MNYCVEPFDSTYTGQWDESVRSSRNGTFLFERRYMDYHAERFCDASLIVMDEKSRIKALFPATWHEDIQEIRSHGGLTYGGLLLSSSIGLTDTCDILQGVCNFYRTHYPISTLIISPVPTIYHKLPSGDELFALRFCQATQIRQYAATVVDLYAPISFHKLRRRQTTKAKRRGFYVEFYSEELASFWTILSNTLNERHHTAPVHTFQEISLLQSRFPQQITLHVVKNNEQQIVGGTLLYHTPRVIHAQYIAASAEGRQYGALDLLFTTLIRQFSALPADQRPRFFDFGTSMENDGLQINPGLVAQKEGFGGHTICYDKYEIRFS